ncbi:hypothetical protein [Delftia acidovorans]|uniref:hypothetical protein n=1 Tax=Delftia acidovorans TaxID=80866 RepID=UPI0028E4643F|nr:hypothetical protein [Delftia acidovorans]
MAADGLLDAFGHAAAAGELVYDKLVFKAQDELGCLHGVPRNLGQKKAARGRAGRLLGIGEIEPQWSIWNLWKMGVAKFHKGVFMDACTPILTVSPSGEVVEIWMVGGLIKDMPRGTPRDQIEKATPIRYELEDGRTVEEISSNVWRHPISGEELVPANR